jgi:curved DNA-binding protein CbpA
VKPLSEQDHYEVLEISPEAGAEGIERAYRTILATYAEDSLAGYSVVHPSDAAAIRERVETAYRVLADAESRRAYDASLASAHPEPHEAPSDDEEPVVRVVRAPVEPFEDLEDGGEYDGARLRRARLRRGLDFEELAKRTKVNPAYLSFLEEERFADLPPRVYVRGFVIAFARCLGLDGVAVAASYMRRYDDTERPGRRRRFSLGT